MTDDLTDETSLNLEARQNALLQIEEWLFSPEKISHFFWDRLRWAIDEFQVPRKLLKGILDGVRFDFRENLSFENWDDLNVYVQGVACDVGEVVLHLLNAKGPQIHDYATNMGRCVQYLNIMRDLESDLQEGRVYVPKVFLQQINANKENMSEKSVQKRIREELFKRAMNFRQNAKPYYWRCFPAEMMVNLYIEAAKRYWRFGKLKRLNRLDKLLIFTRAFYQSFTSLRKACI